MKIKHLPAIAAGRHLAPNLIMQKGAAQEAASFQAADASGMPFEIRMYLVGKTP